MNRDGVRFTMQRLTPSDPVRRQSTDSLPDPHATLPGHMAELDLWSMLFVFMLATFVGFQVIQNVSRLLHTPLMSLTNAISAIAIVGAILDRRRAGIDARRPCSARSPSPPR